jgi:hypothetical protein
VATTSCYLITPVSSRLVASHSRPSFRQRNFFHVSRWARPTRHPIGVCRSAATMTLCYHPSSSMSTPPLHFSPHFLSSFASAPPILILLFCTSSEQSRHLHLHHCCPPRLLCGLSPSSTSETPPIFLLIFVYSDAMLPRRWCCCLLALGPLHIFLTYLVSQPRA